MELTSAEQVYHVTRICVDSYEKQVPTGWICNPYLEEAVPFHGVMQFLLRMEALLDQLNFPQSFTANRGCCFANKLRKIFIQSAKKKRRLKGF